MAKSSESEREEDEEREKKERKRNPRKRRSRQRNKRPRRQAPRRDPDTKQKRRLLQPIGHHSRKCRLMTNALITERSTTTELNDRVT